MAMQTITPELVMRRKNLVWALGDPYSPTTQHLVPRFRLAGDRSVATVCDTGLRSEWVTTEREIENACLYCVAWLNRRVAERQVWETEHGTD